MSSAMPHGPHQPSSMIVVAPNRNQSIMVASIIIMTVLVIVTVGLLLWILVSGRTATHQEHDSVLLQNQEMATTSADQTPPRAVPVPAAPVEASTSTNSGGNAQERSYDSLTVAATRCGSYDYAGMADYYGSYVSICRSGSKYLYRAHTENGDLELPASKVGSGHYIVGADPHMITVHEGIVTVTDSNGDIVRTIPLYDWKYEYSKYSG